MEDHTNPFFESYLEDSIEEHESDRNGSLSDKPPVHTSTVTVDAIAEYLLNKQYILTALEFHTEILEGGKELPRLRNYFSNPAHFEQQANFRDPLAPGSLFRAGSCSTFDSLDLTRYSDDGTQQDDKVAVLEFELRKAKETINSLRINLTDAVEQDSFLKSPNNDEANRGFENENPGAGSNEDITPSDAKPLEKRALNYLVNEYLLQSDYKLTSITLADENEDQDFEDWDDVGLNMPKPPNLLKLYREYSTHAAQKHHLCNVGVGTNGSMHEESTVKDLDSLKFECERLEKENSEMTAMITQLQEDLTKQASVIITSTPDRPSDDMVNGDSSSPNHTTDTDGTPLRRPVENLHKRPTSNNREQFVKSDSSRTLVEEATTGSDGVTLTLAHCNGVVSDDMSEVPETDQECGDKLIEHSCAPPSSRMSAKFWEALLSSFQGTMEESWLSIEVSKIASTREELVSTLSSCLPKIVPTVLLQKRDQLIPLLLCTAAMHPSPEARNKLLHDLFNLIKKPDKNQRHMILCGCMAYAKHVGPIRTEEDLLPQCWEQIGHKYVERRHLVAEACGAITPYLRAEMRSSLLLSILQQMQQEERVEEVRQAVAKSLSVVFALLQDNDKYNQAFEMLRGFLRDSSSLVKETTRECLLPSFASWARQRDKLHTHLFDFALLSIESIMPEGVNDERHSFEEDQFVSLMETVHILLPHLFIYLLMTMPQQYECNTNAVVSELRDCVECDALCDPVTIIGSEEEYTMLLAKLDACAENADVTDWDAMSWCLNDMIPRLLRIAQKLNLESEGCIRTLASLFNKICTMFGRKFIDSKLDEKLKTLFIVMGKDVGHQIFNDQTPLTSAAVPVYASGVLATFTEKNRKERLSAFLKEMITTLSSCHASLKSVNAAFVDIRKRNKSLHELLLDVLWAVTTHSSSYVRAGAATLFVSMAKEDVESKIISTRVLPALITLSTDINSDVRTAAIPALGAVVECPHVSREVVDRIITQMATFMAPSQHDVGEPAEQQLPSHSMNVQLVRTMAHVGPKAHPKFRDEFILPHLAAIAASNNQSTNKTKCSDIALELLDAYTNISCCFISDGLLQSAFLPGVRCLLTDMEKLHPEHAADVSKLIKEKEMKLDKGSITSSGSVEGAVSSTTTSSHETGNQTIDQFTQAVTASADDAKKKIMTTFTQIKARTSQSGSNLFKPKQ